MYHLQFRFGIEEDQNGSEIELSGPVPFQCNMRVQNELKERVSGQVQFQYQDSRSGSGVEEMILERIGPSDYNLYKELTALQVPQVSWWLQYRRGKNKKIGETTFFW